jgi:hypothetical protein
MNKEKRELDQFYTNPEVAKQCVSKIKKLFNLDKYSILEPSAGAGSFSDIFKDKEGSMALDLDPKKAYIKKQDFLLFDATTAFKKPVLTIGNPPFGKNSSLAIKFFNKSAEFSDIIAMIVPKTFNKDSVVNKLSLNFELVLNKELKKNSFIFDDEAYDVPCTFQIWEKTDKPRDKIKQKTQTDIFEFVKEEDNPDFAIRRVGGLAGKLIEDFSKYKKSSHYYIKSKIGKEELIKSIKDSYEELNQKANNTAGNPSLSKHEFITIMETK